MTFMERVAPIVDDTIAALSQVRFVEDPIAGVRYSRATSIVSSAYKQAWPHLGNRAPRKPAGQQPTQGVARRRVPCFAGSGRPRQHPRVGRLSAGHVEPYNQSVRKIQIDMVAFDSADQSIRAYEIKRGNGQFDAGKIRSITRDLKCIQVLLKSYGDFCRLKPAAAESKIIFYYGIRSIPRPWSLIKDDLDEHFGFPVAEKIEQANDYFRTRLHALLAA